MMSTQIPDFDVTFEDIEKAYDRISKYIEHTPVITSSTFDQTHGKKFYFKSEQLQKTGSFKARGALNAVLCAKERNPKLKGVITLSSGNHGIALAWAASIAGIGCCVVLSNDTLKSKKEAIEEYGADVVLCEHNLQIGQNVCKEHMEKLKYHYVSPSDDYDVIAGQGTIALEFFKQVDSMDAILINTCAGGMAAGICIYAKSIHPKTKVYLVEPDGKMLEKCLREGKRLWKNPPQFINTIAEGLELQQLGHKTWPILLQYAEKDVFTVNDKDIVMAMRYIFQRMKFVVEPSGAASVAAVMSEKFEKLPRDIENVGIILCGGNVDLDKLPW